jgi:hypothetical protein
MKQITHKQLMRAILHHGLNVGPCSHFITKPFKGIVREWKELNYDKYGHIVATEYEPAEYVNSKEVVKEYDRTECTEVFYDLYVKTVPSEVFHCRTCSKFMACPIQRENIEDYCNGWTQNNV